MKKIDKETYLQNPARYELRTGNAANAPLCPYGNQYQWLGFDKEKKEYVRFSKRLFKSLIQEM